MSQIKKIIPSKLIQQSGRLVKPSPLTTLRSSIQNINKQLQTKMTEPTKPQKIQESKQKAFEFYDVSEWKVEGIVNNSLLDIITYIRFYLFTEIDKQRMKALIIKLANITLKVPEISKIFLESLQTRNFEKVYEFAEKFEVKDLEKQIQAQYGYSVFLKDMDKMIEIYMENDDEVLAYNVLQTLISSSPMNEKEWKAILDSYYSLEKENKQFFVSKILNGHGI
jgi:hypothetical protein